MNNWYTVSSPSMSPNLEPGVRFTVVSFDTLFHNQIAIYRPPKKYRYENDEVVYVSRIVGVPGDSLEMKGNQLLLNGEVFPFDLNLKHGYSISTSMPINERHLEGIESMTTGNNQYRMNLSSEQLSKIKQNKAVQSMDMLYLNPDATQDASHMAVYGANPGNWGPVRIPKKGDVIDLTSIPADHFYQLVNEYEPSEYEKLPTRIVVTKDYYFVISDNRHNALDSRFTGFVPRDYITGVKP